LNENLSLKDAHEVVTRLESELRNEVPEVTSILTQIESELATVESVDHVQRDSRLERQLQKIAKEFSPEILDVHDVRIKRLGDKVYVSCHSTMQDNLPISRVHDLSTAMETRFKQDFPDLFRILIHPEPQTDNARGFDISDLGA